VSDDVERSLPELRARIDALDEIIVSALTERFACALEIGAHKGVDVQDNAREAEVLTRVERLATTFGGDGAAIRSTYDLIVQHSREIQRRHAIDEPAPPVR
jgi:chorismate mutase